MRLLLTCFLVFAAAGTLTTVLAAETKLASPAAFARPATGNGSARLVSEAIRHESRTFKTTPQGELRMHVFYPPGWKATDRRPVMVFFFGGGWRGGSAVQFIPQAEYFASRGLVCALADFRVATIHGTTPDICVEDAKSAVRWVRGHAAELGADPEKLISAGGSSGGHMAASVALVPGFDAPGDNLRISTVPNAMVLFNPGLNFAPVAGAKQRAGIVNAAGEEITLKISPFQYLKKGTPPSIIFYGTADDGLATHGQTFFGKSRELGNRCELWTAAGQPHAFFNRQPWTTATAIAADRFLASLGYLKGPPTLHPADAASVMVPVK